MFNTVSSSSTISIHTYAYLSSNIPCIQGLTATKRRSYSSQQPETKHSHRPTDKQVANSSSTASQLLGVILDLAAQVFDSLNSRTALHWINLQQLRILEISCRRLTFREILNKHTPRAKQGRTDDDVDESAFSDTKRSDEESNITNYFCLRNSLSYTAYPRQRTIEF